MKLNKPPVTEEQTALEEYVDFLLTDLSNVTPIHGKKSSNEQPHDTQLESPPEVIDSATPSILVAVDNSHKQASPKGEVSVTVSSSETELVEEEIDPEQNNEVVASFISKEVSRELSESPVDKSNPYEFAVESEEEELKKWDAVLTKEKEEEFLEQQRLENKRLIKADKQKTKNEQERLNAKPHKKIITPVKPKDERTIQQARPAIFDEALPQEEPDERLLKVEKLLSRISLATKPLISSEAIIAPESKVEADSQLESEISEESAQATFLQREITKTKDMLPEVFQTLIFNVSKLPLAVPLLKLGGIVPMSEEVDITPLVGTPDWFLGLMPHDKGNLMVVDTQKYLMPEKINIEKKEYQYLILLDNSNWALACHDVGDAKNLTQDDIRWSEKSSKRPWFGGMVVDYMSALIEVDELINMLAGNISE